MRYRWLMLLTALTAVLILCGASGEESPNLLRNAGFEQVNDWNQPEGWVQGAYRQLDDYTVFFADQDCFRSGGHSVCIVNYEPNDAYYLQTVEVQPESCYRLSGWIRAEDVTRSEGQLYDRGASLSIYPNLYVHTEAVHDGDWTYVEMYGETNWDQTSVTVALRLGGYSGDATGTAWFDDISLVEMDEVPGDVFPLLWFDESALYDDSYNGFDSGDYDDFSLDDEDVILYEEPEAVPGVKPFTVWFLVISAVYTLYTAALFAVYLKAARQGEAAARDLRGSGEKSSFSRYMPWHIALCLMGGLFIRLVVAFLVRGYAVDIGCNTIWGAEMVRYGPSRFYLLGGNRDYPPGYMYIFGLGDLMARWFGYTDRARVMMVKLFPILADLAIAWLISLHASRNVNRRLATLICLVIVCNPVLIINGAAWGQIDSVLALLLLLVVILAGRRRWEAVFPIYMLAVLFKPQALMFGPIGLAAVVTDLLRARKGGSTGEDGRPSEFALIRDRMLYGFAGAVALAMLICIPFSVDQPAFWLPKLYAETMSSYPHATVNTANLYYLLDSNWSPLTAQLHVLAPVVLAGVAVFNHRLTYYGARKSESRKWRVLLAADIFSLLTVAMIVILSGTDLLADLAERIAMGGSGTFEEKLAEMLRLQDLLPRLVPKLLLIPLFISITVHRVFAYVLADRSLQGSSPLTAVELLMMDLFIIGFAVISVMGCTWAVLQIPSILLALAIGIPIWLHRRDSDDLALAGAVILLILYVCSTKMHERYFFPGLVLLALACMSRRNVHLCVLFLILTVTEFINTGIPLDNNLIKGWDRGHLEADTDGLAKLLSMLNLFAVFYAVWTARRLCVSDRTAPAFPLRDRHAEVIK